MFYKPNYCCHCGEKIERANWSLTASRRFCEICETDFTGQEWLPKIFVGVMALIGIFGFGSYLQRSGEKNLPTATRSALVNPSDSSKSALNKEAPANKNSNNQQPAQANNVLTNTPAQNLTTKPSVKQNPSAEEQPTYFCGAPTRKGTPCSRRVKGGGRCWQHKGQTAMLPPEQLIAN